MIGRAMISSAPGLAVAPRVAARHAAQIGRSSMSTKASVSRSDISKSIAHEFDLTGRKADEVVSAVFDTIVEAVARGEKVSISGFGTFQRATRAARTGRNPRTGESLDIPATNVPKFSALKGFKDAVKAGN